MREIGSRNLIMRSTSPPEVQDFHRAFGCDLRVRRLQITVDDAFLMGGFESLRNLAAGAGRGKTQG